MITLKYKEINNGAFQQALHKFTQTTALCPRDAYNVARISDKVRQETKHAKDLYFKILRKYAKVDEQGSVVQTNTAPFFEFAEGADKEAWAKEYEEFLDITFEIRRNKMTVEALPADIGLAPADLLALESLWVAEETAAENVVQLKKSEK